MIYVCDAIMGSGKSMAAINYMREHKEQKFLYITPYLSEVERMLANCEWFSEPLSRVPGTGFTKRGHIAKLVEEGKNIAATHETFKTCSEEMTDYIQDYGYTLISDENVQILEKCSMHPDDIRFAVDAGAVKVEENGKLSVTERGQEYDGEFFAAFMDLVRRRELYQMNFLNDDVADLRTIRGGKADKASFVYWLAAPRLFTSFKNVIILTYMFQGSAMHCFLKANNMEYQNIGVVKDGSTYRFSFDGNSTTPDYVYTLKNKIHILDREKMNRVGEGRYALSLNWYQTTPGGYERMRKNLWNLYRNIWKDSEKENRMWSCYKSFENALRGNGYTHSFVPFNARATNEYMDRKYLAYLVNLYMNVTDKHFYSKVGLEANDDAYALSTMVQWVWRSAIRKGEDIYLYVPSERMRNLFTDWINVVSEGGVPQKWAV